MNKKERQKELFKTIEYIRNIWEKISGVVILNQEITINTLNLSIDYELSLRIPNNFWSIPTPIIINDESIIRISISSQYPIPRTLKSSLKKVSNEYVIYPELIPTDCEIILFKTTYKISKINIIKELVYTSSSHDPGGSDENEYWLHAQLTDPSLFDNYTRFDMRDVDVTVGVRIINELNTAIPTPFINRLRTVFEILDERDPRQQWRAIPKLRALSRHRYAGSEFEILKDLEALFLPSSFRNYVEVKNDFRYDSCMKGKESYKLPIEIIPELMDVVSRADLTLEQQAAEGTLIYNRNDLRSKIESFFK